MKVRFALLWLVWLGAWAGPLQAGENRRWLATYELEGPLERLILEVEGFGETVWSVGLAGGERTTLDLPVPGIQGTPSLDGWASVPAPRVTSVPKGASVVFAGWRTPQPGEPFFGAQDLARRARPPVPGGDVSPGAASLALALAALVLGLAWCHRPRTALVLGLVAGLGCGLLVLTRPTDAGPRRVLEGQVGALSWFEVWGRRGRLVGSFERVEVQPAGAPLRIDVGDEEEISAPGRALYGLRSVPALDRYPPLAEVWVRTPRGEWSGRGAWSGGDELLRPPVEGAAAPGWLRGQLPQGVGVLLGRFPGPGQRWLRVIGFLERD